MMTESERAELMVLADRIRSLLGGCGGLHSAEHDRRQSLSAYKLSEQLYGRLAAAPLSKHPDTANESAKITHDVGRWLSAALDDPAVCTEMKADINAWFAAGQPNVQPSDESAEARLRDALKNLCNEVKGALAISDWAIREAIGNTNVNCIKLRLNEAEIALSAGGDEATKSETCQRCQGNGEIVTDWAGYLHPTNAAAEERSVAECPDCDGEGKDPPAPRREIAGADEAVQDALDFLDELAANAASGKRKPLNPIIIGGSARFHAKKLRAALLRDSNASSDNEGGR